jgi:hypothetical protein
VPGMNAGLARAYATRSLVASADTGPILLEGKNFSKWNFAVFSTGTITGGSLLIYGTLDTFTSGVLGNPNMTPGLVQPASPSAANWFPLIAPSGQSETAGSLANPITSFNGTQQLNYAFQLVAVRCVMNAFTGGGTVIVNIEATP